MISLAIRHARLATMEGAQAAPQEGPLALIEDGAVAVDGERIAYVGPDHDLAEKIAAGELGRAPRAVEIDAAGALVTPGFVDPHTHLLFAGDRSAEFAQRLGVKLAADTSGLVSLVPEEEGNELRAGELWPWLWLGVILVWLAEGFLANRTVA